jgi:hypothetical protein
MQSNKNDLSKLEKCLDTLISIDASGCGEDLKNRLITLKSFVMSSGLCLSNIYTFLRKLSVISVDCRSLAEKHRLQRFVMGKEYKQQIQSITDSIASHIQEFTVRTFDYCAILS